MLKSPLHRNATVGLYFVRQIDLYIIKVIPINSNRRGGTTRLEPLTRMRKIACSNPSRDKTKF